ncbi:MAG: hypothetical protein Q9217_005470 [Psora testacea]
MRRRRPPPTPPRPSHSSNFLTLPPEIRHAIYNLLLSCPTDICIPHSLFKRRNRPASCQFPDDPAEDNVAPTTICPCRPTFRRGRATYIHWNTWCDPIGQVSLPPHPLRVHKTTDEGPWAGIVWTCRTVYEEACPVLYSVNTFQFDSAGAAQGFRWASPYAVLLRKMHIVLSPIYKEFDNRVNYFNDRSWRGYLRAERFDLCRDYPHVKHLTLTLGRGLEVERSWKIEHILRPFRENLRGVSVFEVRGVNDENLLPELFSIVRPLKQSMEGQEVDEKLREAVQMSVSEYEEMPGWKNAILWWGKSGEAAPVEGRPFGGDKRFRRRLYRVGMGGGRVEMSVGESVDYSISRNAVA